MEAFTYVDGIVLAILAVSAVLAYARGFVREVLAILGWVAAAFAGFLFAPAVAPLVNEVPLLRDIIGGNCELALLAAFALVFAAALVLFSVFTPLVAGAVQNSALGPIDQGLGFLFGVARGVLLVVIALLIYELATGGRQGFAEVDSSRSRAVLADLGQVLEDRLPDDTIDWVGRQFATLTQNCP